MAADWGALVDVVGFCFLQQASEYKPPEDLVKWLEAGPTPIYVGFGSLVSCKHLKCCTLILPYSLYSLLADDQYWRNRGHTNAPSILYRGRVFGTCRIINAGPVAENCIAEYIFVPVLAMD